MVSVRVARWTYGVKCSPWYTPSNFEHAARSGTVFTGPSGEKHVPDGFNAMLVKGTEVSEDKEFSRPYIRDYRKISDLESIKVDILCYRGISQNPQWMDVDPHMFSTVCTVTADTRRMTKLLKSGRDSDDVPYYRLEFDTILLFGLTELKAQIRWIENDMEMRCPAELVYG
jgi:hypothetical protein